jgi:hypothetical protein
MKAPVSIFDAMHDQDEVSAMDGLHGEYGGCGDSGVDFSFYDGQTGGGGGGGCVSGTRGAGDGRRVRARPRPPPPLLCIRDTGSVAQPAF